jgi:hypothetical protein
MLRNPEWWDDRKWFPRWEDLDVYTSQALRRGPNGAVDGF